MDIRQEKKTHYIHLAVWAILQIIIWILPPVAPLTPAGMHTLAIFVGLLYGLCFVKQYAIPCLMAPLLMTFSGAYESVGASFSAGYGGGSFVMMFSILLISGIVIYSGLAKALATRMLNWKLTNGRPWVLTFVIIFASAVLSTFIHPIVVIAVMSELVIDIFRKLKMKGNRWTLFMLLDLAAVAIQAQDIMPFQQGPVLMYSIMTSYDARVSILNYGVSSMLVNGAIEILLIAFCFFITWLLCKKDVETVKNYVPDEVEPFNENQKIALWIVIIYVLIQLVSQFLPNSDVKSFLVKSEVVGYSSLFACIAMFVRKKDGTKFITIDQIASNGFNWFTLLMLVGLGSCCDAMTSDSTGILQWLTGIIQPICEGMSPFGVFVFLCAFCIITTNIIDNIAVIFVIIPVIYVVCTSIGFNPAAMMSGTMACIQMGIAVPGATPHIAMIFAKENTGYVKFGGLFKWSLVRSLATFVFSISVGWLMMQGFADPSVFGL